MTGIAPSTVVRCIDVDTYRDVRLRLYDIPVVYRAARDTFCRCQLERPWSLFMCRLGINKPPASRYESENNAFRAPAFFFRYHIHRAPDPGIVQSAVGFVHSCRFRGRFVHRERGWSPLTISSWKGAPLLRSPMGSDFSVLSPREGMQQRGNAIDSWPSSGRNIPVSGYRGYRGLRRKFRS